jgi:Trypsin-like peptidase domain
MWRLREIISMLIACSCMSPIAVAQKALPSRSTIQPSSKVEHTQDISEIVVPITSLKPSASIKLGMSGKPGPNLGVEARFGTGFCLDAACEYIVTNYHVAITTRASKIQKQEIFQRYFATGPNDKGATPNSIPNVGVYAYATKRDLALFELRHPLAHHHGLAFNTDELQVGQEVDIYGYPKGVINPFRTLTRFPAKFKGLTTSGLLAFDYQFLGDQPIRIAGSSGGIVVDAKTQEIVGILSASNETTAAAVPIQTLVEFVTKVQPFLAQKIFPATKQIPPMSPDIYPKFVPVRSDGLQHRVEEPSEVKVLRQKAQFLTDSIRNFIAVETFAWGTGNKEPEVEAAYEVRVIDGYQRFREYPDGKKESKEPPWPPISEWINPLDEWSQLPEMIGTELRLKIHQSPDVFVSGQRLKVFQYYAGIEDNVCGFRAFVDYVFFTTSSTVGLACYGEVWTDEHINILRISEQLDFSQKLSAYKGWQSRTAVLTYGWLKLADQNSWLVPLTTYVKGQNGKHIHWCRGHFMDYQVFGVQAKLVAN